jgi:hypothetical protein
MAGVFLTIVGQFALPIRAKVYMYIMTRIRLAAVTLLA